MKPKIHPPQDFVIFNTKLHYIDTKHTIIRKQTMRKIYHSP